jgi:PPM family protein phosphatase
VPKGPDYDVSTRTGLTSHVVTQCLGGTSTFTEITPHIASRPLVSGSIFLLCSDGLTDMLDQDEIEDCIDQEIEIFVDKLFKKALASGGHDNVSICVLKLL